MTPTPIYGFNMTQFRESMIDIANNNINIVFMWGNHDLEAPSPQQFGSAFNNNQRITMTTQTSYFYMGVMYEHGHYYDIFNAPFPPSSNLANLVVPYGYTVCRALAQSRHPSTSMTQVQATTWAESQFAGWTIDFLTDKSNMEVFLWALVTYYGEKPPDNTLIVGGDPTNLNLNSTYGLIIPAYNNMINEWISLKGKEYATNMLIAAVNYDVDYFVKLQPNNVLVNIQGHTHVRVLDRLNKADGTQIIYANSGAWVDASQQTWVDVLYNGSTAVSVSVGTYASGNERILGVCVINDTSKCSASMGFILTLKYWNWLILLFSGIYFFFH